MAVSNRDRVGQAFEALASGLGPYVDRRMRLRSPHGANWLPTWRKQVPGQADASLEDPAALLRVVADCWDLAFREELGRTDRNLVFELRDVRNNWAHNKAFTHDDAYRALDSVERLLTAIDATEASEVGRAKEAMMRLRYEAEARKAAPKGEALTSAPAAGLKPWREIIAPHDDVARGKYALAEFAADLWEVHQGKATTEYVDPVEFFRRTFLTDGLRKLLTDAIERVAGGGGIPVVDLQTNFGGGKTHSMIALYHLFSGRQVAELPQEVQDLVAGVGVAGELPPVRRAVLAGHRLAPGQASTQDGRPGIRTLWGELAWQLGGAELFAKVADADRTSTNPGNAIQEVLAAAAPCLVLIDEWVAYARQLYDAAENLAGGSFDTQFTFAQMLTEAARAVPGALVVVSLPASSTSGDEASASIGSDLEVGGPGGHEALARLRNVIGRTGSSWRPASAEESFEIVRRRLFKPIEPALLADRDATARLFADLYRKNASDFPPEAREPRYEARLKAAYPIHPELFDRLYDDWSTLERFQRTRGVLRLLASVVASLWSGGDQAPLIMPASLSLADSKVSGELERNLEDRWKPIIDTDVDGESSLPARIDAEASHLGRYQAAHRVARTVFLGSAATLGSPNRGIDVTRIRLGCALPGEQVTTFGDALNRLAGNATYLYVDNSRYWYGTQPSVARIARDRAERLLVGDRHEITARLVAMLTKATTDRGVFAAVPVAPSTSAEVLDEPGVRLVVLGPAAPHLNKAEASRALEAAAEILDRRGNSARELRNTLVFLAADHRRLDDLVRAVADAVAWETVAAEAGADDLNLDPNQTKQARTRSEDTARTAQLRLAETWQWLLVPEQHDPTGPVTWATVKADGAEALAVRAGRKLVSSGQVYEELRPTHLRLALDEKAPALWEGGNVEAGRLWDAFSRYLYLPRVARESVFLAAVADGPASTTWINDGFALADTADAESGRYRGLVTSGRVTAALPSTLLVKPEVALAQREADEATTVPTAAATAVTTTALVDGAANAAEGTVAAEPGGGPRRFWAAADLDPERLVRAFGQLNQELIGHLSGLEGAHVRVRVEIEASTDSPEGFPDNVVRTVTENANTLKIGEHGFEDR